MSKYPQTDTPGKLLDALNDPTQFDGVAAYNLSKLLEIFVARELAALPIASNVVINTANPGLRHSSLRRDIPSFAEW
jgi:hypothetical protein